MNNLTLGTAAVQILQIPLTEEEVLQRRVDRSKCHEVIDKFQEALKKAKAELEYEFGVKEQQAQEKVLGTELRQGYKLITMKVTEVDDPEMKMVEILAAENKDGYKIGDVVHRRPMTIPELFNHGLLPGNKVPINN